MSNRQKKAGYFVGIEAELGSHVLNGRFASPQLVGAVALVAEMRSRFGTQSPSGRHDPIEFLEPGFRAYVDHAHAEACTPLVPAASGLALAMRQMRQMVRAAAEGVEEKWGPVCVSLNITNRQDASWGYHFNVAVPRWAFDAWMNEKLSPLYQQWVPHVAASTTIFGCGKVGSERGKPPADYQLSQRADHIEPPVFALETVRTKHAVNTRDEPHADPAVWGRFHIIAFDLNLLEFAQFVRYGTTQVLLALIAEGVPLPNVRLADPVSDIGTVSRDLTFARPLVLLDGRRMTALDIERALAEACAEHLLKGCDAAAVPDAQRIVALWIETLDDLVARRVARLARRLDWVARARLLRETAAIEPGDREALLAADLRFAEIGGSFERLEAAGEVDRLEDFLPAAPTEVLLAPREEARRRLLARFGDLVVDADWSLVVLRHPRTLKTYALIMNELEDQRILAVLDRRRLCGDALDALVKGGLAAPVMPIPEPEGGSGRRRWRHVPSDL